MKPAARGIEAGVLGKLLVIQQTLEAMPDAEAIASFLGRALREVPGIAQVHLCVDGALHPHDESLTALCGEEGADAALQIDQLLGRPGVLGIPLRTSRKSYGSFIVLMDEPSLVAPYHDFIRNIASTVAAQMETQEHLRLLDESNAELRQARDELERRVEERTAELQRANALLQEEVRERMAAAQALEQSMEETRRIIESSPVAMALTDERSNILYLNRAFSALFGYTREDIPSIDAWWPRAYPEPRYREGMKLEWERRVARAMRDGAPMVPMEGTVTCKDGTAREIVFDFSFIGDRGLTLFHDITGRKAAENALRESEERFRMLVENVGLIFWLLELPPERVLYVSPASTPIWGHAPDEFYAKPRFWMESVVEDDRPRVQTEFEDWINGRTSSFLTQYRIAAKNGETKWIHTRGVFVRHQPGGKTLLCGIAEDITRRKQSEELLTRLTSDLMKSNKELDQFAYIASHDLREPLRTITSYLQLLQRRYGGKLDRDADDFIGFAMDGSRRMLHYIDDLLAYSRIATRAAPRHLIESRGCLEDALKNLQSAIDEGSAKIESGPLPAVIADPGQLTQVFQNLIANAIKFRRAETAPAIAISAADRGDAWEFAVADNGIGIDERHFERIFQIFQRLHGPQEYPGSGMGLAIVKKIIERHGGAVGVRSAPDAGSTFTFTIPKEAKGA